MQVNDKLFEEDAVYHHRCYINFFNYKKNIDGTTLVPSAKTTHATEIAAKQHAFLRAADALVGATGYMSLGELVAVQERVLRSGPCTTATAYDPRWMEKKLKGMFGDDVCVGDAPGGGSANKRVMYVRSHLLRSYLCSVLVYWQASTHTYLAHTRTHTHAHTHTGM